MKRLAGTAKMQPAAYAPMKASGAHQRLSTFPRMVATNWCAEARLRWCRSGEKKIPANAPAITRTTLIFKMLRDRAEVGMSGRVYLDCLRRTVTTELPSSLDSSPIVLG